MEPVIESNVPFLKETNTSSTTINDCFGISQERAKQLGNPLGDVMSKYIDALTKKVKSPTANELIEINSGDMLNVLIAEVNTNPLYSNMTIAEQALVFYAMGYSYTSGVNYVERTLKGKSSPALELLAETIQRIQKINERKSKTIIIMEKQLFSLGIERVNTPDASKLFSLTEERAREIADLIMDAADEWCKNSVDSISNQLANPDDEQVVIDGASLLSGIVNQLDTLGPITRSEKDFALFLFGSISKGRMNHMSSAVENYMKYMELSQD